MLARIVLENIYSFIKIPLEFLHVWMTYGSFRNNIDGFLFILFLVFCPVLLPIKWVLSLPENALYLLNVIIRRLIHAALTMLIYPVLQTYINISHPESPVTLQVKDAGDYYSNYGKYNTGNTANIEFSSEYFEIFTVGYHMGRERDADDTFYLR